MANGTRAQPNRSNRASYLSAVGMGPRMSKKQSHGELPDGNQPFTLVRAMRAFGARAILLSLLLGVPGRSSSVSGLALQHTPPRSMEHVRPNSCTAATLGLLAR